MRYVTTFGPITRSLVNTETPPFWMSKLWVLLSSLSKLTVKAVSAGAARHVLSNVASLTVIRRSVPAGLHGCLAPATEPFGVVPPPPQAPTTTSPPASRSGANLFKLLRGRLREHGGELIVPQPPELAPATVPVQDRALQVRSVHGLVLDGRER